MNIHLLEEKRVNLIIFELGKSVWESMFLYKVNYDLLAIMCQCKFMDYKTKQESTSVVPDVDSWGEAVHLFNFALE